MLYQQPIIWLTNLIKWMKIRWFLKKEFEGILNLFTLNFYIN